MKEACLIARECPGFGHPLDLPVDEFDEILKIAIEMRDSE